MPEILEEFLRGLAVEQAEEVWEYLDGHPAAIDNMIAIVAKSVHEN